MSFLVTWHEGTRFEVSEGVLTATWKSLWLLHECFGQALIQIAKRSTRDKNELLTWERTPFHPGWRLGASLCKRPKNIKIVFWWKLPYPTDPEHKGRRRLITSLWYHLVLCNAAASRWVLSAVAWACGPCLVLVVFICILSEVDVSWLFAYCFNSLNIVFKLTIPTTHYFISIIHQLLIFSYFFTTYLSFQLFIH